MGAMAIVLAHLLAAQPEYPRMNILELGSGAGLVALVAAGRGHSIVATYRDECVLQNLRVNVAAATEAGLVGEVRTRSLRWQAEPDRAVVGALGPFDMIAGADLIYSR